MTSGKFESLIDVEFFRLTVKEIAFKKNGNIYWKCECICGNFCFVRTSKLKNGHTRSCGCLRKDLQRERALQGLVTYRHGLRSKKIYKVWSGMLERCRGQTLLNKKNYKDRGITVYEDWCLPDGEGFINFKDWAYEKYPNLDELLESGYQIDREDNDLGYSPENCRFVTAKENMNNRRIKKYDFNGQKDTLKNLSSQYGKVSYSNVLIRLKKGWTITESLLTLPNKNKGS